MIMTKVKVHAESLKVGDILANGNEVVFISGPSWGGIVLYQESNGNTHEVWKFQGIDLDQETNCIYGGYPNGHSKWFCTADSCY